MNSIRKDLNSYLGMTKRNILIYLKDKMTLLFSMLSPLIVLCLYLLFLKNTYVNSISSIFTESGAIVDLSDINALVNSWLLSGVLGTSVITVSLSSLVPMVEDKAAKIDFDYTASPVKKSIVFLSYLSGAFVNTFFIASVILSGGFIVMAIQGAFNYTFLEVLESFGVVALGSLSATLFFIIFVSFFKRTPVLSAFSVIISTASGFVVGAYIPLGQFSITTQKILNAVPGSVITGILRNILMTPPIDKINTILGGVDNGSFVSSVRSIFSLDLNMFINNFNIPAMYLYSIVFIGVLLVLNLVLFRVSSKRKY